MTKNQERWLKTKDQRNAKRRVPPELKQKGGRPKGPSKIDRDKAILAARELLGGKRLYQAAQSLGVRPETLGRTLEAMGLRKAQVGKSWVRLPE